jgi:Ca-activated chloride channel homolog
LENHLVYSLKQLARTRQDPAVFAAQSIIDRQEQRLHGGGPGGTVKSLALAPVLLMTAVTAAAGQSADSAAQAPVFRSGASLVALNVTVTDLEKRFVTGLNSADFAVYEDGVQQAVSFFESSQVPIDLIVLLDSSSSMQDKMDTVQTAAMGFLHSLRPGDRGAVVAFNDRVNVVQALTGERNLLDSAVRQTSAHGGTALNNALYVALKEFGSSARDNGAIRRRAIAILSDGEDTASLIGFEDVLELSRKSGVCIYTIGLQSRFSAAVPAGKHRYFSESQYALKSLAQETGGEAFFPLAVNELQKVYDSIAKELSTQYSLAYTPSNPRSDGRYRRIVVRIVSRPDLRSKSRSGYTAAPAAIASVTRD